MNIIEMQTFNLIGKLTIQIRTKNIRRQKILSNFPGSLLVARLNYPGNKI